jgi:hypothetical protein
MQHNHAQALTSLLMMTNLSILHKNPEAMEHHLHEILVQALQL